MSNTFTGILVLFGITHFVLVVVPIVNTLQTSLPWKSKLLWTLFLLVLPFVGVATFHFRYRSSLFQGKGYEVSAAEERARSGTLAPRDHDS